MYRSLKVVSEAFILLICQIRALERGLSASIRFSGAVFGGKGPTEGERGTETDRKAHHETGKALIIPWGVFSIKKKSQRRHL